MSDQNELSSPNMLKARSQMNEKGDTLISVKELSQTELSAQPIEEIKVDLNAAILEMPPSVSPNNSSGKLYKSHKT